MNLQTFKKEFIVHTDIELSSLYISAIPSVGRHFCKFCEKLAPGIFRVEIEAPEGDFYYCFKSPVTKGHINPEMLEGITDGGYSHCRLGSFGVLPIIFEPTPRFLGRISGTLYEIKVVSSQSWIRNVALITGENPFEEIEMELCYSFESYRYYKLLIEHQRLITGFCFKINSENKKEYFFTADYKITKEPTSFFLVADTLDFYETANHYGVVYHIFPDSFHRSRAVLFQEREGIELGKWGDLPSNRYNVFYGGNLCGILEKIDYLKTLGISYIYLNPIFPSRSNHRYDYSSLTEVDPNLGTPEDLHKLVTVCHQAGIKVLLDAVMNHCGVDFEKFQELVTNQEKSRYRDWFCVHKFPVRTEDPEPSYSCWWNIGSLPQFNLDNPEVREYIFQAYAAWLERYDLDGFRVDVASELGFDFLREFRRRMRAIKPDVYLIGEVWSEAVNFLKGDQLDGVTNYHLLWQTFVLFFEKKEIGVAKMANNLINCYFMYPHRRMLTSWNILSSHDLPRFISRLKNKTDIFKAIFLQMFLPGNPVVYYGEEVGLEGGADPDNRRCMDWETGHEENEVLQWYQTLIKIRNAEKPLQEGHFKILTASDETGLLLFVRELEDAQIYCAINFSTAIRPFPWSQLSYAEEVYELLSQRPIDQNFQLQGGAMMVFKKMMTNNQKRGVTGEL